MASRRTLKRREQRRARHRARVPLDPAWQAIIDRVNAQIVEHFTASIELYNALDGRNMVEIMVGDQWSVPILIARSMKA